MDGEQRQRRKRVSDGGLGNTESEATPVRILPDGGSATPSASDAREWVLEFGDTDSQDDPTTRLPSDGDAERPLRPGTLYTHATTPHPLPRHAIPAATPSQQAQTPQQQVQPAQAIYNQPLLQAPAIQQPSADRSLMERPAEHDTRDKQPLTIVKRGPTPCAIFAATFGVIAIACALLTFATIRDGFSGLGNLFGWVPNIFSAPKTTIDASRPSVIERVSSLGRLETVKYQIEKVASGESTGWLPDWISKDRLLLVAHGDVIAGVDLTLLKAGDITVMTATNSVTIKLPKADVFNPNTILDNQKTYVYDRSGSIFHPTDAQLETNVRRVAEEQILQAAIEDGILLKAQQNAMDVVKSLVIGLGYKDVKFESGP